MDTSFRFDYLFVALSPSIYILSAIPDGAKKGHPILILFHQGQPFLSLTVRWVPYAVVFAALRNEAV
jgi:hypothetical protein